MAIAVNEVVALMKAFHDTVMFDKGDAAAQAAYFLYPEPRIYILRGADLTLEDNYRIHQKLTDERHEIIEPMDVVQLSTSPDRARAIGAVYWQGRVVGALSDAVVKCLVGEDWIVQRDVGGDLKIALYINTYHRFLPDSAPLDLG